MKWLLSFFKRSRKQCCKCGKTFYKPYTYYYSDFMTKRKESPCCHSDFNIIKKGEIEMEFKEQFIVKGFNYKGELVGEQYCENYPSEKNILLFLEAHPTVDYCKVDKVFKKVRPFDEQRKKEQLVALQVAKEIAKSFVTCPACNKPIVEEATNHICKVTIPLTEEKDFDWDMTKIQDFASSKYNEGFAPLRKNNKSV